MAKFTKKIRNFIEEEALNIVDQERAKWRDAPFYITEDVGFKMRELIRLCRKNYWGVFQEPVDPNTGREKLFAPLSQGIVEDFLKNIDVDSKDVGFRARHPEAYALTDITRAKVRETLDRMYFGEILDADERTMLIDGTIVWKTWEEQKRLKRKTIDVLNVYIDPAEESIHTAFRFTVRDLALPDEISSMSGWMNTENIKGSQSINRVDNNMTPVQTTSANYQDVWDMWGKIPKYLITGNKKDSELIDGHIIVSGLDSGDKRIHLIEENNKKDRFGIAIKPYEEGRAAKIAGRWYGLGLCERVLALQEYLNTVMNIRINRAYVSQLGLFKIKKGRGITPQMLSRLASNGAIQVQEQDDIEQFQIQEVGASSYKDEEVVEKWAQRVTSTFPVTSGEPLPSSTTATAAVISNTSAKSAFVMFKEGIGFFLERWTERQVLPIEAKSLKIGDLVRMKSDDGRFKEIADRIIGFHAQQIYDNMYARGQYPDPAALESAIQSAEQDVLRRPELFLETSRKLIADAVDPEVIITNEELDVPVTVQNLLSILPAAPEYRESIIPQIFDLLGLERPRVQKQPSQMPMQSTAQPNTQSLQELTTNATLA